MPTTETKQRYEEVDHEWDPDHNHDELVAKISSSLTAYALRHDHTVDDGDVYIRSVN